METTDIQAGQRYQITETGDVAEVDYVYGRGRNRKVELRSPVRCPGHLQPTRFIHVSRFAMCAAPIEGDAHV